MTYGNPHINTIIETLSKLTDMDRTVKDNRQSAQNLLQWAKKNYPNKEPSAFLKNMIEYGFKTYHKEYMTNVRYIYNNRVKIIKAIANDFPTVKVTIKSNGLPDYYGKPLNKGNLEKMHEMFTAIAERVEKEERTKTKRLSKEREQRLGSHESFFTNLMQDGELYKKQKIGEIINSLRNN